MSRRNSLILSTAFSLIFSGLALAQGPGGPPFGPDHPPMERAFHDGHFGRWWNDPHIAQQLNVSDDQKHRMDDIFLQHRLRLIDLAAALEKQEVLLRPMLEADQPNEAKVLAQIDSIAQTRADLEKANARMLFDIRKVLTPDQWKKLKALRDARRDARMEHLHPGPGDGPRVFHQFRQLPPPPDGSAPAPAPQAPAPGPSAPAAPPQ